ncbi:MULTISPECIES: LacI family DNA-binding transcriptional regulator [unclassified Thermosipho (in: thermotogales)]|uniref:LacI family DNA-binding transcriptional regulator n=1 Tax=unclassified Thermosipho (in: thermotogales) TaxID=2676525 RepID=UPI000986BC79|nr:MULTISPECIES: LacI family DNA-binding transcriptional regulator [unclassified Thermosipho (in: thermotogales)]
MQRPGIKEVAKKAGVSISTVSRVLNNSAPVSEELKKRVKKAIEELGYYPSNIAKGLRKGRTGTIGFILPDITNPFFANIVRGAEDYLRKKGYNLILCNSDQDRKQETELLKILISKHIDGLLFTGTGSSNPLLVEKIRKGLKVVFLDRIFEEINSSYVIVDNKIGMNLLLDYLIDVGHRSFIFINGNKETFSAKIRYEAFTERARTEKLEFKHYFTEFSYEAGYKKAKRLKGLPDAILCGNDLIAYGVIDALEEKGYKVPEDVSVTGFDDIPFSKHFKPPLTTVYQPMYEMGRKSAKLLLEIIEEKKVSNKGIVLLPKLVIRESTKEMRK